MRPSIASNRAAARSARFAQPNGLAFSVDERRLYITATSSLYSVLLAVSGAKTF